MFGAFNAFLTLTKLSRTRSFIARESAANDYVLGSRRGVLLMSSPILVMAPQAHGQNVIAGSMTRRS